MTKVNNTYTYYKIKTLMECLILKIKILYNPTHQKRILSNTYFPSFSPFTYFEQNVGHSLLPVLQITF